MESIARHPEGKRPRGVLVDQALDRRLCFDYNGIKYGADRRLLNQQKVGRRTVPCPTALLDYVDTSYAGRVVTYLASIA